MIVRNNIDGTRVLKRNPDIKCESWYQLLLFCLSMIALVFLIIGATVRNLQREELMKMKHYPWRVKRGINRLLIKNMAFKMVIITIAVFGPASQYWPPIACFLLSLFVSIYWLIVCPYIRDLYNHIVSPTLTQI
jgi:glucose uptake protein GlcU